MTRSFITFCLFLLLVIGIAADKLAHVTLQPVDEEYYCSVLYSEPPQYCPKIYQPVCAKYQVQCIRAPCPPIEQTYSNGCTACQDPNVISYSLGECKKKVEVEYCADNYPTPPYPCPKIYDPVCVSYDVECIRAPCPPIQKEYSNACMACNDNAGSYTPGPCQGNNEENEEEQEYEQEIELEYEQENYENGEGWTCEDYEELEEYEEIEEHEEHEENEEQEVIKKACNVIPGVQVLCIHDYIPVCGCSNNCPSGDCCQTYRNNCVACYWGGVDYYTEGECNSSGVGGVSVAIENSAGLSKN